MGASSSDQERWKREAQKQLTQWTPRRLIAWSLFVLAAVIAVQHLLAHAGMRPLPFGMGKQDLLIGYPTAGLLALAGGIILGAKPSSV